MTQRWTRGKRPDRMFKNRSWSFSASPPDVVVTMGPPAAAFYPQNRDKVFPATPLVITGVDERFVLKSALRAGDAAVASHQSLPGVVDNILRVLPDTQRI